MNLKNTFAALSIFALCGCGNPNSKPQAQTQNDDLQESAHSIDDQALSPSAPASGTYSISFSRFNPPRGIAFDGAHTEGDIDFDIVFEGCRGGYTLNAQGDSTMCNVENLESAFALGADPSTCNWNNRDALGPAIKVVVDRHGENYFLMEIEEDEDAMLTLTIQALSPARCSFVPR